MPHVELVGGSFTRNAQWTAEVKSAKLVFDADQPCGSIEEIDSLSGGCRPAQTRAFRHFPLPNSRLYGESL